MSGKEGNDGSDGRLGMLGILGREGSDGQAALIGGIGGTGGIEGIGGIDGTGGIGGTGGTTNEDRYLSDLWSLSSCAFTETKAKSINTAQSRRGNLSFNFIISMSFDSLNLLNIQAISK